MKTVLLLSVLFIFAGGCSDDDDAEAKKEHVWQEQTEALDKARAVEDVLRQSADDGRKQIDEQTQQ